MLQDLPYGLIKKSMKNGAEISQFGRTGQWEWLEEALPLHDGDRLEGVVAIVADAGYIRSEGIAVWQRSFWRILALVVLIVACNTGDGQLVLVPAYRTSGRAFAAPASEEHTSSPSRPGRILLI